MTKVEEVARAICKERGFDPDDDAGGHCSPNFAFYLDTARVAIAAMRRPDMNIVMQLSRKIHIQPAAIDMALTSYIDAILSDPHPSQGAP